MKCVAALPTATPLYSNRLQGLAQCCEDRTRARIYCWSVAGLNMFPSPLLRNHTQTQRDHGSANTRRYTGLLIVSAPGIDWDCWTDDGSDHAELATWSYACIQYTLYTAPRPLRAPRRRLYSITAPFTGIPQSCLLAEGSRSPQASRAGIRLDNAHCLEMATMSEWTTGC